MDTTSWLRRLWPCTLPPVKMTIGMIRMKLNPEYSVFVYAEVDLHPADFAVLLVSNGMQLEHAVNLCDVSKRDVENAPKGQEVVVVPSHFKPYKGPQK